MIDPCAEDYIGEYPMACDAKIIKMDATPLWFSQLSDQVIAFGKDFEYKLGKPEDNYGNEV